MHTHRRHNVQFGAQLPSRVSRMPAHRHRTPVEGLVYEIEALARGIKEQKEANELYRAENDVQVATQANTIALLQEQVHNQASAINDLKKSQQHQQACSDKLLHLHHQSDDKIVMLRNNASQLEEDFQEAKQRDDKDIDDITNDINTIRYTVRDMVGEELEKHAIAIKKLKTATKLYADHNSEVRKALNKSVMVLDERTIDLNERIDSINRKMPDKIKTEPGMETQTKTATELPTEQNKHAAHNGRDDDPFNVSFTNLDERVDYHGQCIRETRHYIAFTLKPELDSMEKQCKDIAKVQKATTELEKTATRQHALWNECSTQLDSCAEGQDMQGQAIAAIEENQERIGQVMQMMMRRLDRLDWDEGRLLQSTVSREATPEPGSYDELMSTVMYDD